MVVALGELLQLLPQVLDLLSRLCGKAFIALQIFSLTMDVVLKLLTLQCEGLVLCPELSAVLLGGPEGVHVELLRALFKVLTLQSDNIFLGVESLVQLGGRSYGGLNNELVDRKATVYYTAVPQVEGSLLRLVKVRRHTSGCVPPALGDGCKLRVVCTNQTLIELVLLVHQVVNNLPQF